MSGHDLLLACAFALAAFLYATVGHAGASGYLAAMAITGMAPEQMKSGKQADALAGSKPRRRMSSGSIAPASVPQSTTRATAARKPCANSPLLRGTRVAMTARDGERDGEGGEDRIDHGTSLGRARSSSRWYLGSAHK